MAVSKIRNAVIILTLIIGVILTMSGFTNDMSGNINWMFAVLVGAMIVGIVWRKYHHLIKNNPVFKMCNNQEP